MFHFHVAKLMLSGVLSGRKNRICFGGNGIAWQDV
jgi:hypothetical protein